MKYLLDQNMSYIGLLEILAKYVTLADVEI